MLGGGSGSDLEVVEYVFVGKVHAGIFSRGEERHNDLPSIHFCRIPFSHFLPLPLSGVIGGNLLERNQFNRLQMVQ